MVFLRKNCFLSVSYIMKHFFRGKTNENYVSFIKTHPQLLKVDPQRVSEVFDSLRQFNIRETLAMQYPLLFKSKPSSVINRCNILLECGFTDIKPIFIISYFKLVKDHTIKELMEKEMIPKSTNVYRLLCGCFSNFPTSEFSEKSIDIDNSTLYSIRMTILQKYIENKLSICEKRFQKLVKAHHQFRHRPFRDIEESLKIALEEIKMPLNKIITYPYVICVDPKNTRKILNDVKSIGGIDVKTALRKYPGIIRTKYKSITQINEILDEFNIPNEFRKKWFHIYTLQPETVKSRFSDFKKSKFLSTMSSSEKSIPLLVNKNKVEKRLNQLKSTSKKCVRVYSLIADENYFQSYSTQFGDKSYSIDLIHIIAVLLNTTVKNINLIVRRHSYFNYVPISSVIECVDELLKHFTKQDIIDNIHVVFYSWEVVKSSLEQLKHTEMKNEKKNYNEKIKNIDYKNLTKSQILALTLYLIEKEHVFTGDGIWTEKSMKTSNE